MTPEHAIDAYRDLVAVNSQRIALELSQSLRSLSTEQQRNHFGGSMRFGFTWLYRDDAKHPDKVMETVASPTGDAITSVYINHRCLNSLGTLAQARENLINALAQKVGLSYEAIGVEDPGRGRALGLAELSTGQLVDMLSEQMGASVMTTGSVGGDSSVLLGVV